MVTGLCLFSCFKNREQIIKRKEKIMGNMDICMLVFTGVVDADPETLSSGRRAFTVSCKNAEKRPPLKIAVIAETQAMNIVPQKGDFVAVANASLYEERRAGCSFGAYAKHACSVNICARNEGIADVDKF